MKAQFDAILRQELEELAVRHLGRVLREWRPAEGGRTRRDPEGREWVDFASNDYLGLAFHPAVVSAGVAALRESGGGSMASRLITGSLEVHQALERDLAALKGAEGALLFSTGYATALGALPALVGPGDFVLLDRLAHACLVDGARLSGARLRVWRHNDVGDLGRLLRWVAAQRKGPSTSPAEGGGGRRTGRVLIVTESVFSMDGDVAPLRDIVECRDREGPEAWLMVDEAHATGVLGPEGRGWIEAQGVGGQVEIVMGTLGKALGAAGGFIAGSGTLREYLVNRARSFLFSTAPVPAASAAASAALRVARSAEGEARRRQLWERVGQLHRGLREQGWELPDPVSPIVPLLVGDEACALHLAGRVREAGLIVPAIRHPTVRRGRARLRITLSAAHRPDDVECLLVALRRAVARGEMVPTRAEATEE